jgi:STE24 endopeptidase
MCVEAFYLILRHFPDTWWLFAASAWIIFTVVLVRIFPVVLIPLFYKYSSIEGENLKDEIFKIAEDSGIDLIDVCKIDFSRKTTKANAALVGLGRTRKVILSDTLLSEFNTDQIKAVVAHEFGHYKYRHISRLLLFNSITTVAGFFFLYFFADAIVNISGAKGIFDIYIMPLLFLIVTLSGIFLMPLQNWFSRRLEKQADRFSLEFMSSAEPFIEAMRGLARINLAEIDPPLLKKIFLYNHPTIKERISFAQIYKK